MKKLNTLSASVLLLLLVGSVAWKFGAVDIVVDRFSPKFNLLHSVDFHACHDSKYYPGHDTGALNTAFLDGYLAAVDASGSSLCFDTKESKKASLIKFVWYSRQEAPARIEVFGILERDGKEHADVLWSRESDLKVDTLNEFFYSSIELSSSREYQKYRIDYVSGAGQNRLLLRSVAVFFETAVAPEYRKALADVKEISGTAPYGVGIKSVSANNVDELAKELSSGETLHCGNYSYLMAYRNSSQQWAAVGAISKFQAAHAVVEFSEKERAYTADATLGIIYKCSYADMLSGSCNFSSAMVTDSFNPVLWRYTGENFFPGATVQVKHSTLDTYFRDYIKVN